MASLPVSRGGGMGVVPGSGASWRRAAPERPSIEPFLRQQIRRPGGDARLSPGVPMVFIAAGWPGLPPDAMIETGDRAYCLIGHRIDNDALARARGEMIGTLNSFRDTLEEPGAPARGHGRCVGSGGAGSRARTMRPGIFTESGALPAARWIRA